ncbi:MAG: hypothetical protein WC076_01485 [Terrimicrobiaceae bacterium]|nr:hypothetical protein [Terrimicrobiaceae bacterium]
MPITAYGEYAEGFEDRGDSSFLSVVEPFEILPVIRPVADTYAQDSTDIAAAGPADREQRPATAVQRDWPLVTRDLDHFSRIPGIRLMGY